MPYTEQRTTGTWRVRYKGPDGKYLSASKDASGDPFLTEDAAMHFGLDQETDIRRKVWQDPRAQKITFAEWVAIWFPAQELEPSTLANYASLLRSHIAPVFNDRTLESLYPEEIVAWEMSIKKAGYAPRTARDARSVLINILGDAIPRLIPYNPALRKRGKGKKGTRRIEAWERAAKAWPTPGQAVDLAERIALLTGQESDFIFMVGAAWTGMRWGELLALQPALVKDDIADVQWKIYELNGKFYWGRPKAGSIRKVDLPPFLDALFQRVAQEARRCTCTNTESPWCDGSKKMLFLSESGAHHGRSNFSTRAMRPAADGIYPGSGGKQPYPAAAVLVNAADPWPGHPLSRQGDLRRPTVVGVNSRSTKSVLVEHAVAQGMERADAMRLTRVQLLERYVRPERLAEDAELVEWGPVLAGLTPHGLRHGHQTWMDDGPVKKAIKVERMGHEDLTMQGVYGHVTDGMRQDLRDYLEGLWAEALAERFARAPRSPVPVLDQLLEPYRDGSLSMIVSRFSPRNTRGRLSG